MLYNQGNIQIQYGCYSEWCSSEECFRRLISESTDIQAEKKANLKLFG